MLTIDRLKATSVRNLKDFDIKPGKGLNLFYGPNASGKTSVLETIFLLSRVKSFRSKRVLDVVSKGDTGFCVYAEGEKRETVFSTGIEKGRGFTRIKFNGDNIQTASEQAKNLPVFIITPEFQALFTGTPKDRRHWLDWSLFHVKPDYLAIWKSYNRALRHRNALLKQDRQMDSGEMSGWELLMEEEANKIDSLRQNYVNSLVEAMNERFLPQVMDLQTRIKLETNSCKNLSQSLSETRSDDQHRGYTSLGPHRSDIKFLNGEFNVAKHFSRGQTKLFSAALISAQTELLKSAGTEAMVMVDDLDAELDEESAKKMVDLLAGNGVQSFVTSIEKKAWLSEVSEPLDTFHVKHGCVNKVIE